ncbi:MAG TPA: BrnA antitoxin family protein [Pyrinomonadaceae bacterium]|nr:BrnA antitoxin family protein [Pyrinomonadaceae bacterium]
MSKTDKDLILEVTQEEYDEAMKKGWTDDDIQKPGKYRFRRTTRVAKPEDISPSNIKVQVTLRLDSDVLEHFKKRASDSNAAPYQTQINAELRKVMEKDLSDETTEIKQSIETLAANKEFIRAVAEQLKELKTA